MTFRALLITGKVNVKLNRNPVSSTGLATANFSVSFKAVGVNGKKSEADVSVIAHSEQKNKSSGSSVFSVAEKICIVSSMIFSNFSTRNLVFHEKNISKGLCKMKKNFRLPSEVALRVCRAKHFLFVAEKKRFFDQSALFSYSSLASSDKAI